MTDQTKWRPSDEEMRSSVFHAFAMHECRSEDPMAVVREMIDCAVEKAQAEQWQENLNAKEELIRRFHELSDQQEKRHRREVIEAKISALMDFRVEIGNETGLDDALALYLTYLRAELAALDKEAK